MWIRGIRQQKHLVIQTKRIERTLGYPPTILPNEVLWRSIVRAKHQSDQRITNPIQINFETKRYRKLIVSGQAERVQNHHKHDLWVENP